MIKYREILKFSIVVTFMLLYGVTNSQTISKQMPNQTSMEENIASEYFIGFDTGSSNNFKDILETLQKTKGINVLSYCEKNNIIKISFSKENFKELVSIFEMVENSFREVICYHMKHYTDESYFKMCSSELVKRSIGGGE